MGQNIYANGQPTTAAQPLDKQVGGNHYKDCVIQPIEYCHYNNLGTCESAVIKRMTRWNKPSGKGLQDLEKAKHEIELLIEMHTNGSIVVDGGKRYLYPVKSTK